MRTLPRDWVLAVMIVILLGGLATVLNIGIQIGQPFGGVFTSRSYPWLVDPATPPWWPALNSGLRYDDELVALEGNKYSADSYLRYAQMQAAGKHSVMLTVRRSGELLELEIPIRTFSLSNLLDLKLPDMLVGLGFWLLAAAVYMARPTETVNRIFAVACSAAAGALWLTIPSLFPQGDWLSHLLQVGWVCSATFVGVGFIHLSTLFPEPAHRDSLRWIKALYMLMVVTAIVYIIALFLRWENYESPLANFLSTISNRLIIGSFGLAVLIYLVRLVQLAWIPTLSRRVRRQVFMLAFGLLLALPYVLVVVVRALLVRGTQSYFWNGLDLRYLVLAVPLTFAFVILRYQSFQRTPMPIISVLILASSALVASLGAWVVRLLEPEWVNSLTWTPFAPLFGITLLTSIIWSSQSSWWGALSRLFQWERRSYIAVRKFGQQVINENEPAQLPQAIAKALVTNMELERAAVWLWDEKESAYRLAAQAGEWLQPAPQRLTPDHLPDTSHPVRIPVGHNVHDDDGKPFPGWLEPLSRGRMIEIVTPLAISGKPVGLLGSGKRWDEEIFDDRDIQITELIAQQAGLFLLTALQIEQLRQVPQQIATAQERERFKIAQELHDTVQQFLGRLPFFLEVSRSSVRTNPEEAEAILKRCIEDVDNAAKVVRQIRNNLAPLQLEKSLSQPLALLVEQFSIRSDLDVQAAISPDVDTRLSPEARHALYRVVQQALDNIAEHANASHVTIKIGPLQERMHFSITDDGTGFGTAQRLAAEEGGSFGLKSMEARITSQGGEFNIQAGTNAGTKVSGWLPMLHVANAAPGT